MVDGIQFASFNVRGLAKKEVDLESLCLRKHLHFVCLQEINSSLGALFAFSSYLTATKFGKDGKRGMMMLYDPAFAGHVSEIPERFEHVQIFHIDVQPEPIVLINVYLPCRPTREVLNGLTEEIERVITDHGSDTSLVIAGDFNCNIARGSNTASLRSALNASGFRAASATATGAFTYQGAQPDYHRTLIDFIQVRSSQASSIANTGARFVNGLGAKPPKGQEEGYKPPAPSDHKLLTFTLDTTATLDTTWVERPRLEDLEEKSEEYVAALTQVVQARAKCRATILREVDAGTKPPEEAAAELWTSLTDCYRQAAEASIGIKRYLRVGAGFGPPRAIKALLAKQANLVKSSAKGPSQRVTTTQPVTR